MAEDVRPGPLNPPRWLTVLVLALAITVLLFFGFAVIFLPSPTSGKRAALRLLGALLLGALGAALTALALLKMGVSGSGIKSTTTAIAAVSGIALALVAYLIPPYWNPPQVRNPAWPITTEYRAELYWAGDTEAATLMEQLKLSVDNIPDRDLPLEALKLRGWTAETKTDSAVFLTRKSSHLLKMPAGWPIRTNKLELPSEVFEQTLRTTIPTADHSLAPQRIREQSAADQIETVLTPPVSASLTIRYPQQAVAATGPHSEAKDAGGSMQERTLDLSGRVPGQTVVDLDIVAGWARHAPLSEVLRLSGWPLVWAAVILAVGAVALLSRRSASVGGWLRAISRRLIELPGRRQVMVAGPFRVYHRPSGCPSVHHGMRVRTVRLADARREGRTRCDACWSRVPHK